MLRFAKDDGLIHVVDSEPRMAKWGQTVCGVLFDWQPLQGGRWAERLAVRTDEVPTCFGCIGCGGRI